MTEEVCLTILDKEYRLSSPPEEKNNLELSARYLDEKMQEIRNSGKVIGMDRIAVLAAINITHELITSRNENVQGEQASQDDINRVLTKLNTVLEQSHQLELN